MSDWQRTSLSLCGKVKFKFLNLETVFSYLAESNFSVIDLLVVIDEHCFPILTVFIFEM
jgi:hypothetical protein